MSSDLLSSKQKKESLACAHCDDICINKSINLEDKIFCCDGCKMVYSILTESGLDNFYRLDEKAGISQKNIKKEDYQYLEDQDIIDKLVDFTDDKKTRIKLQLPDIHCSSCLWLLENLYRLDPGVLSTIVNFPKKEASILFDNTQITLKGLAQLLAKIGYPPSFNYDSLDQKSGTSQDKTLLYQLGFAGFAFGNIMLLSFPEYFGLNFDNDTSIGWFIRIVNSLIAVPLVFYSARPYLKSAWSGLKNSTLNIDVPISIGIITLFIRSLTDVALELGPGYFDSLAGLIFFLLVGRWFQKKTFERISFDRDYKSYFPISVEKIVNNQFKTVSIDKIEKDDRIRIKNGDILPADCILRQGEAYIDYSFVTGESDPIKKNLGDKLFAGGRQTGGIIELEVQSNVNNSYLTELWNNESFQKKNNEHLASELSNKTARYFTTLILAIAFATLFYWLKADQNIAINAFTSVLIIACPCAIALSIPFTLGNIIRLLGARGIYFKDTLSLERMANIDHVVFDKTGTITETKGDNLLYKGKNLSDEEQQWIFSLAHSSSHPLSRGITKKYQHLDLLDIQDFTAHLGKGITGNINGHRIDLGSLDYLKSTTLSTLTPLSGNVHLAIDHVYYGSYTQKTKYRDGLEDVVKGLGETRALSLISGDNDSEKEPLKEWFDADSLHFRQSPEIKLEYIKNLQSKNLRVAMIGDGLNDAGALMKSDVGIVVTEDTSNFTPACDVIINSNLFGQMPSLFSVARQSIKIIYFTYLIALLYNVVGLSFAVQGLLSPVIAAILMPLSSITIVVIGVSLSTFLVKNSTLNP